MPAGVSWSRYLTFFAASLAWGLAGSQTVHLSALQTIANKVLGLIRRTFDSHNPEGVSTAYNTLVRPILEYGCHVWNPYLVKHIKSIESVQRRATRVICGSEKEYQERLGVLKWPSLELQRKFVCFVQIRAQKRMGGETPTRLLCDVWCGERLGWERPVVTLFKKWRQK